MKTTRSHTAYNEGIDLAYKCSGKGLPLLMIHGSCTDSSCFTDAAAILSQTFTVITYDRSPYRKNDRKKEGVDYSVEAQAQDAAHIIVGIGVPCFVFAHSGGAIIGMELATRYPEYVRHLVAYEPLLRELLPKEEIIHTSFDGMSKMIKEYRFNSAAARFVEIFGEVDTLATPKNWEELKEFQRNMEVFLATEFEFLIEYPANYELLKKVSMTIALSDLNRGSHFACCAHNLAEKTGKQIVYFPGSHNGPTDRPLEFSNTLADIFVAHAE